MKNIIKSLKALTPSELDFDSLGKWVHQFDFKKIDYKHLIPSIQDPKNYARNILTLKPIECVILYWPPQCESAIHYHEGFWGYVAVLEGIAENMEYRLEAAKVSGQADLGAAGKSDGKAPPRGGWGGLLLIKSTTLRSLEGGIFPEPDNVIHKIINPHPEKSLVTVHFYYPALKDFAGMKIYDIENCKLGILNEKAQTASWNEPEEHFQEIVSNAFRYIPYYENNKKLTHKIYPIVPKPHKSDIRKMVSGYYEEQAREYDSFDTRHESRNAYVQKINKLVAKDLVQQNSGWPSRVTRDSAGMRVVPSDGSVGKINNMLMLACGTGRRAIEIREQTKLDYEITCVEMSKEMCKIAQQRGLNVINAEWLEADLGNGLLFDAVTFLYAFGHIPSEEERKKVLMKVNKHLNIGGYFYFDAFNIKDKNEWGASAVRNYEKFNLSNFDYQEGDVFYKKVDGEQFAFLHYFTEDEIISLLEETGFELDQILNVGYVKKSGKILDAKDEGAFFIKARKKREIS